MKKHSFKAFAIINKRTGRVMITNQSFGKPKLEVPEIWMTRAAAKYHAGSDERIVPVIVTEA